MNEIDTCHPDDNGRPEGGSGQCRCCHAAEPAPPWTKLGVAGAFALFAELADLFGLGVGTAPVCALVAVALSGTAVFREGWRAVRRGELNMNALMAIAVTGAACIGEFPEAAMVMVLFNLSEALETLTLARAREAIGKLIAAAPETATVLGPDGEWTTIDARRAVPGDRVRVRPGEKVALDGLVVSGHSTVNQAPITGESLPAEKREGDAVFAGTVNESGSFEFIVTAKADDSTLARVIRAVEAARAARAPMQRFVDAFARHYTPAVFLLALLTALAPPLLWGADWSGAVYRGLTVLVIGCPCALVIATPVTVAGGLAAAARRGILVKGGLFLERGRKLRVLALDKPGTLTGGRPALTDFAPLDGDPARAWTAAASLAARSDHPLSRAIARAAEERGVRPVSVTDFSALPGEGVRGLIDGRAWHLGNRHLAERLGRCSPEPAARLEALEARGGTAAVLVGEEGAAALFAASDTVRPGVGEALAELRALGLRTVMLTGDNPRAAAAVAQAAGVDAFRAEMLPEDKLRAVEDLEAEAARLGRGGLVGMAGDGINDAPALARARIGFALAGAGTDAAMETADVVLMDDDLRKIPRFIRLSRGTCALLAQNIALALGIKALFLALAFAGLATMWMAVFADVGASLLVTCNGLRALRL